MFVMNKIELEILEDIQHRLKRNEKKNCLILLDSLKNKFSSKYSYYFHYFINLPEDKKYDLCNKILSPESWILTLQELRNILLCRDKYKDNFC